MSKQSSVWSHTEEHLAKGREMFASSYLKYGKLNKISKEDLAKLYQEVLQSQEKLVQVYASNISNLNVKLVE